MLCVCICLYVLEFAVCLLCMMCDSLLYLLLLMLLMLLVIGVVIYVLLFNVSVGMCSYDEFVDEFA